MVIYDGILLGSPVAGVCLSGVVCAQLCGYQVEVEVFLDMSLVRWGLKRRYAADPADKDVSIRGFRKLLYLLDDTIRLRVCAACYQLHSHLCDSSYAYQSMLTDRPRSFASGATVA